MSQQVFTTINPATTSGTQLATILVDFKDALMSGLTGTSRPAALQAGGMWVDTTQAASPNFLWKLKIYDGTSDIELFRVNLSTGLASLGAADSQIEIRKISADTVGPILNLLKERIANNGQVLSGDVIGEINFTGSDDTGANPVPGKIQMVAGENFTATANGGYISFLASTQTQTALTEIMRLRNGKVGIGITNPSASLEIKAGGTAANSAPIKLNSGTLMTTPEIGAVEFLTDDLYFTKTTGTARVKVLDATNSETVTNKTMSGANNTFSAIPNTAITGLGTMSTQAASSVAITGGTVSGVDIDGGTASNTSRLTLPKASKATLDGLTRKEGTILFATDEDKAYIDTGSDLVPVGSGAGGGGINYIANPDAESNTLGWSLFADGATLVDGTGGTATATFTRSTSSPLRGAASFLLTPGTLGDGVNYAFTVPSADFAKVVNISFDYQLSGTITEGDYQVYIYDVTNSQLIQPAPFRLSGTSGTNYRFNGTFQTSASATSYRLIVWQAVSTAVTLKLDNVQVGPGATALVGTVTDWQTWTPTGSWVSNATYAGRWRQVGDMAEYDITITTSGAPTAANLSVNIFPGHVIDTAKLSNSASTGAVLGVGAANDFGANSYPLYVLINNTTSVYPTSQNAAGTYASGIIVSNAAPFTFGATDFVHLHFSVPILGWSSSAIISQSESSEGRPVVFRGSSAAATAIGNSATLVPFPSVEIDSYNRMSSGIYTVPVPGDYQVSAFLTLDLASAFDTSAGRSLNVMIYKNGSLYSLIGRVGAQVTSSQYYRAGGSDIVPCIAGDTIAIYAEQNFPSSGSINLLNAATYNALSITKVSGQQAITAAQSVNARYTRGSAQTITNSAYTTLLYTTLDRDSHGSYNTSTGIYTPAISGSFRIKAQATLAATTDFNGTTETWGIELMKVVGTTLVSRKYVYPSSANVENYVSHEDTIYLLAGEQIYLRAFQNSGADRVLNGNPVDNFFTITRTGN